MRMDAGRRREVLGHRIWISDAGQDDGVPLLLLHGGPGVPHDHFEPLVEALRERRRVIVYDQLGCGLSDKPQDESLWTVEHYLAELQEIVRKLKLKDFAILGQSWGGMLALEYAALRPEGLRGHRLPV